MTDAKQQDAPRRGDSLDLEAAVLELNFEPEWARKPAAETRFEEPRERPRRGAGRPAGRRDGPPGRPRPPRRDHPRERPRERPQGGPRERPYSAGPGRPPRPRVDRPPPVLPAPIEVRILPEQKHLAAVVRRVHASHKAFPIFDLASIFLAKPEFSRVRVEPERDSDIKTLYQCKACGMIGLESSKILQHAVAAHLDDHFERQEIETEPPAGQFVCVARCGLTGTLLGPPNHHSYEAQLLEIHRTRFAGMPLEQYRGRIEVLRDPELIEQWKETCRKQVRYRPRDQEGEDAEALTRAEATARFSSDIAPGLVHETRRAMVPAALAVHLEDESLRRAVREAWLREERFPLGLSFALKAAFRHMHLHLFKSGRGVHFVTPVHPAPLNPDHAVDAIKQVLLYLREHPGTNRAQLTEALCPGAAPDSTELREIMQPLGWLIEKGHIIEFFNGTLAVPLRHIKSRGRGKPRARAG